MRVRLGRAVRPVLGQNGIAATENPLATQIALDVLKKGGSAIDAAIAASAAPGLMQPVLEGIGGDRFVIVWDPKTKQLYGYNGSGRSPKAREGFPVAQLAAQYWKGNMASFEKRRGLLEDFDNAKHTYLIAGDHAPAQGEIFKNPDLANTYEKIARGGGNAFYKGEIAHMMDAYFKRIGNFGGYQAIPFDAKNHVYWGATEMRKDGAAAGY